MTEELRIGLIGCGGQARLNLCPALKVNEGIRLVACADVDGAAAQKLAAMFGFERSYRDYREMLAEEKLEAVVVVIPHSLLKEASIATLEAGCHLFVEKPMAMNVREAREILAAASKAKRRIMVGYCMRFAEGRMRLKELVEAGAIGEPTSVVAGKGMGRLSRWLLDPKMGGGQLLFLGVHITDQVLWTLKSQGRTVYAQIDWDKETGVDETSVYTVRFANGIPASFTVSMKAGYQYDYLEVLGSQGRVRAEWRSNIVYVVSNTVKEYATPTTIMPRNMGIAPMSEMFIGEMGEWVASLKEGREAAITGQDGLRVLEVMDAVVESARKGQPVEIA